MVSTTSPGSITLLASAHDRACSKTYRMVKGKPAVESYGKESRWHAEAHDASTPEKLRAVLESVAGRNVIAVVGGLIDEQAREHILRRMYDPGATLKPVARSWLAIDVDDIHVAGSAPEGRIENLIEKALPEFRDFGCITQFTSSYGMKGGLGVMRCRLWFHLDKPQRPEVWRYYFRGREGIDPAIYSCNQPIYIVPPRFEGIRDPVGQRIFTRPGGPVKTKALELEEAVAQAKKVANAATVSRLDIEPDEGQIGEAVARILTQEPQNGRHSWALGAACELYALGADPQLIVDTFDECLRLHGREPDPGEAQRALSFAARKAAAGTLRVDRMPTSELLPDAPEGDPEPTFDDEVHAYDDPDEVDEFSQLDHVLHRDHTDAKNAAIFVREKLGDNGYLRWMGDEFVYQGDGWRRLEDKNALPGMVRRFALDITTAKKENCVKAIRDIGNREQLRMPCWLTEDNELDEHGDTMHTVSLRNGLLDVRDTALDKASALRPHSRKFFSITRLPFDYDPEAKCPVWERALRDWFPGDPQAWREMQKMFGYLVTTDTSHQKFFMLAGESRAGKGVICEILDYMLGSTGVAGGTLSAFGEPFALYALLGAHVCILNEANAQKAKDLPQIIVDRIKAISGEDKVDVNGKNQQHVHTKLSTRLLLVCNQIPRMDDLSSAITNRMQLFYFRNSYAGREDTTLKAKLKAEIAGIFNWALDGYAKLLEDGCFHDVKSASEQKAQVKVLSSPPRSFLGECVMPVGLDHPTMYTSELYDAFRAWASDQGIEHVASKQTLMQTARNMFPHAQFISSRGLNRPGYVAGVTLNEAGKCFLPEAEAEWVDKEDI